MKARFSTSEMLLLLIVLIGFLGYGVGWTPTAFALSIFLSVCGECMLAVMRRNPWASAAAIPHPHPITWHCWDSGRFSYAKSTNVYSTPGELSEKIVEDADISLNDDGTIRTHEESENSNSTALTDARAEGKAYYEVLAGIRTTRKPRSIIIIAIKPEDTPISGMRYSGLMERPLMTREHIGLMNHRYLGIHHQPGYGDYVLHAGILEISGQIPQQLTGRLDMICEKIAVFEHMLVRLQIKLMEVSRKSKELKLTKEISEQRLKAIDDMAARMEDLRFQTKIAELPYMKQYMDRPRAVEEAAKKFEKFDIKPFIAIGVSGAVAYIVYNYISTNPALITLQSYSAVIAFVAFCISLYIAFTRFVKK